MLMGRFIFVIPLLAVAGSLAQKKLLAPSAGTFPTNRPLFVGLLMGVILIIGGLTYFPAVSLGPAVEQVAMNQGKLFPAP
jgi:K+-transporting ATPase ATPase A chain